MEEIEVPTEHLTETINERAEELVRKKEQKWTLFVAISTALMAVFAAIGSLMAGHHSNEALIEQIKSSDQWAFYQAKSIKSEIRLLKPEAFVGAKSEEATKQEEEVIKKNAEDEAKASEAHLKKHVTLAQAVTLLQVAIAISAISIITRRKFMWYIAMAIAAGGLWFFFEGVL